MKQRAGSWKDKYNRQAFSQTNQKEGEDPNQ
jgi:hypothetical protein